MGIPGDEASGVSHPIILGSKEFNAAPAAHYDWLRREAPVYKGRLPYVSEQDVYFLSRHQTCLPTGVSELLNPTGRATRPVATSSRRKPAVGAAAQRAAGWLRAWRLHADPCGDRDVAGGEHPYAFSSCTAMKRA